MFYFTASQDSCSYNIQSIMRISSFLSFFFFFFFFPPPTLCYNYGTTIIIKLRIFVSGTHHTTERVPLAQLGRRSMWALTTTHIFNDESYSYNMHGKTICLCEWQKQIKDLFFFFLFFFLTQWNEGLWLLCFGPISYTVQSIGMVDESQ